MAEVAVAAAREPETAPIVDDEPADAPVPVVYAEPAPVYDAPERFVAPEPVRWPEPEPVREPEPVLNQVEEPRPELAAIIARMADLAAPPAMPQEPAPWAMAAAAGESESRWHHPEFATPPAPVAASAVAPATPATESSLETSQRFLRPVGSQDLRPGPRQNVRGDSLIDDLNAPAYTRKYMD